MIIVGIWKGDLDAEACNARLRISRFRQFNLFLSGTGRNFPRVCDPGFRGPGVGRNMLCASSCVNTRQPLAGLFSSL